MVILEGVNILLVSLIEGIGYWQKSGMENWLLYGAWGRQRDSGWSINHEFEQYKKAIAGDDIDLKDN